MVRRKTDSNGYGESLFNTEEDVCYVCKCEVPTARHEVLYGNNRENSKFYGLWINVCPNCHQYGAYAIHRYPEKYEHLKQEAQRLFEETFTDLDFMEIFGRNYLANKRL